MHLKIITHEKVVFDEDVEFIQTRGVDGEFGILKGHIPIMSALDIGVTKVIQNGKPKYFTTMGGVLQFKDDEGIILTGTAECGDEIDVARGNAFEFADSVLHFASAVCAVEIFHLVNLFNHCHKNQNLSL